jgi:benzoyl-CoA reductase subunit C
MPLTSDFARLAELVQDASFESVVRWKAANSGKRAVAYFPVYMPAEIIHAAGMLPVELALSGAGVVSRKGGWKTSSFSCSITRSTLEMGLAGRLDLFDSILFSSTCDAARDLSFTLMRNMPHVYVDFVNLPNDAVAGARADLLDSEYRRVIAGLEKLSGEAITPAALRKSIHLYNLQRSLVRRLYEFRCESSHRLRAWESFVLARAGNVLPVEEHIEILGRMLDFLPRRPSGSEESVRVVLEGAFCEQPSLELISMLESSGCEIAEDDFSIVQRWFQEDIPLTEDPVRALAEGFVLDAENTVVNQEFISRRAQTLEAKIRRTSAQAVIVLSATACAPARFDGVMLKQKLDALEIPHLMVEFSANQRNIEALRPEVEKFIRRLRRGL